jgi:hypothetical protein
VQNSVRLLLEGFMPKLLDSLKTFFAEDNWQFVEIESDPVLRLEYVAEENEWTCYAQALEEDEQFVFYSIAPIKVTQPKLWLCVEYLTRANFNLILGNFELDMDSGLVRFKTSIDVEGDRLSLSLFRSVVYSNVSIMERYLPGLEAILLNNARPKEVLALAEGEDD